MAQDVTAYHGAGHMVAAWELGLAVTGAPIVPTTPNKLTRVAHHSPAQAQQPQAELATSFVPCTPELLLSASTCVGTGRRKRRHHVVKIDVGKSDS